jgi:hypothetical protein
LDLQKIVDEVKSGGYDYLFIGPTDDGKTQVVMDLRMKSDCRKEMIVDEIFPPDGENAISQKLDSLLNIAKPPGGRGWDVRFAYRGRVFVGIRCFGPQKALDFGPKIIGPMSHGGCGSGGGSGGSCGSDCSSSGKCKPASGTPKKKR